MPSETTPRRGRRSQAEVVVSVPKGAKAPTALTAAASRIGAMPQAVSSQGMRAPQWQLDSLAYYDQIGPVRYAAQFWARGLSKVRFYAAEIDENGEVIETSDPDAIEAFERVQDPMGGRVGITSTYGQLRFLTGECYLIWTPELDGEPERWEVVSMLELRKLSKRGGKETWHRISAPGLNPQELVEADDEAFEPMPNEVIVYRLWKRHPAYSMMADAPMRSVLAECEEIVRCTHTINARLISRLAGPGIFAIPMSWKVKSPSDVANSDNPEEDPLQVRLTRAMIAAIGTPGSAESVAPIVVRVPDGEAGEAKLYKIWDPNETIRELETREKAIHRFAVGVDMPPGKVEGIEGSTHWNAWAIDKEGVEHLLPVALDFANDLASAYLRPTLRDSYKRDDWDRFVVGVDAAAAVTNPDELKDALELYNNRIVGKAYVRGAGNATDDDAMSDDELAEALFVVTHQVVDVEGGAIVPGTPVDEVADDEPDDGRDTEQDMPELPDADEIEDEAEQIAAAAAYNGDGEVLMVLAQAELAIEEVRSRIGMKVRNHLAGGRCQECADRIKTTPAHLIVAELGPEVIAEQGIDLAPLAENAGAAFGFVLERKGASPTQARAVQEVLERHAVTSIYDTVPGLPAGLSGRVRALAA